MMPAPADPPFLSENQTGTVYIRIAIPELKIQKCLQFELDDTVWQAKQRVLAAFSKDLRDSLNYGLYLPPVNGRAGKFLDEERFLKEYPLQGPIGFLEFKYKRRVYKVMQINPRKLKQLHTKTQLKNFLEQVRNGNLDKVVKLTNKGLDPNFHDPDSGETPLTMAVTLSRDKCREMVMSIVSGGAHIDFRNKQGLTPMHQAAIRGNLEAIKALLDLGASPDYKDYRNLTPLYYCVSNDTNAMCVETLLHERAVIGTHDEQGWFEIHQACRYGRVQHLEHLLYYGGDMDVQNASGNTPLHVCSVNNQESCARVLLFRGANKEILNYNNQTPYQVCMVANNHDLADMIKNYRAEDVVPFREIPKYSDRRKLTTMPSTIRNLVRCRSDPRLNLSMLEEQFLKSGMSNHSLPNSEHYDNGSYTASREYNSDSPRSLSISSSSSGPASKYHYYIKQKPHGLATVSGRVLVNVRERHHPWSTRHLNHIKYLRRTGNFIEVLSNDQGFYEGRSDGSYFPGQIQDAQIRRAGSMGNLMGDTVTLNRNTLAALVQQHGGAQTVGEYSPKTVVLQRRPEGYGFVLRGARSQSHSASLEFQPTAEFPALQYLDSVDPGSQSDRAGLKTGDFILEINGENVIKATHERVVQLIRTSKESLMMKVVTARPVEKSSDWFTHQDGSMTLPNRKKQAPQPPRRNPDTSLSYSKATSKSMAEGLAEIEKLDQTLAEFDLSGNRRHSLIVNEITTEQKTASVRGSHAIKRVSCVDINHIVVGDHVEPADHTYDTPTTHKSKDYMSPAELRIRKYHKKQNGIMERSKSTPDLAVPDEVVYASTNLPGSGTTLYDRSAVNRTQMTYQKPGSPGHYRQGHMADVKRPMSQMNPERLKTSVYAGPVVIRSNSEESDPPSIPGRAPVPAPKKPAPTPPGKSEVVSISTSRNDNVYANVSAEIQARKKEKEESPYESSFRPGTLARLTNQPKVTTASLEQAKLKSHRRSSSYCAMSLPQDEETSDKNVSFADDKTMTNAASFIQKHPNAQLLVTADVHQKKDKKIYYEPEPDYDDSDEDKRSSNTTKLQVPANISRQSSVSSSGSRNASEDSRKDVRPKSTSVTVIAVGDTTMKRKSPVTERHFAIHSDIPSTKKSTPQSQSGEAKIMIPPRPNEPAPHPPTVISNHYSGGHRSSSSPNSSDSSRRSSVQSSLSGGKDSYEGVPMNQAPATFPKPQLQEVVHHTPPPQAPPPPPPPPVAPPVPTALPTTLSSQESQMRNPPKQETPQISTTDIMNAVKLRQSRIETEGPRMVETTPSQPPPPKTPIDMNQLALKAAVEARKQRLQQEDNTAVVDQIESRLHKTKKLQSAKYFFSSDTIKNEKTETPQKSETPEKTPTAKKIQAPPPPNVKPQSPQVAPKTKAPATPLKTEVKSSPVPKPISSSTPVQKPVSNQVTSQNEANDFLAMAEKARLEILQKKGGGTKSPSVTPIYSSSTISKSKKADSKTPEKPKEDPKLSIKDKIASFEMQKQEANGVTNGTNMELDGVTKDHSHTEAGNTLTRNGNSAYSPFMAPPPGFGDANTMNLEIIPPPISFSNDASVDSGQGSDHFNSAFGHDDSASLVSSASTLSTLSSEQGEGKSHYEDIIAPPPPGFNDISEYDESDMIPPPPQFSSIDNKPKPLRPYQTKGVDSWLCTDVLDWLESLGMAQYKSSFAKNCIDGPKLLMLGRNDYIQLGVTQVGHRMNLERSIKKVALGKISTAM